ncbi:MAG TPA: kynureninase [Saprospiraceae bacterium]|nr:kynureninase [Saprospiraceae bacterium]
MTQYSNDRNYAISQDENDDLKKFRHQFHFPKQQNGHPYLYFCGNSLGLQPTSTKDSIMQELNDWGQYGVEGHFHAKNPWMPYHEQLTSSMAKVVGAKDSEVVVMNTLTVNLHLMMVSFYQPTSTRNKILIEHDAFPSDRYAVGSQIRYHGYPVEESLIALKARPGEYCLRMEDIEEVIQEQGESIALVMLGNTNYYTGQYFDMAYITQLAHSKGCKVGFDCAHGAGNIPLNLHEAGPDFAVWCTYKYLNSGPGSVGAAFVHERHADNPTLPRFEGWWGHNKQTRFIMRDDFEPIYGVEAWQLSNPPILSLAAIKASLELFEEAGIENLRNKSIKLTAYFEALLKEIPGDDISIITPSDPEQRGAQLSIRVKNANKSLYHDLSESGVIADWREPDVIRVAPVPLYNSFTDVYDFVQILKNVLHK